jgi:hypothetical protein
MSAPHEVPPNVIALSELADQKHRVNPDDIRFGPNIEADKISLTKLAQASEASFRAAIQASENAGTGQSIIQADPSSALLARKFEILSSLDRILDSLQPVQSEVGAVNQWCAGQENQKTQATRLAIANKFARIAELGAQFKTAMAESRFKTAVSLDAQIRTECRDLPAWTAQFRPISDLVSDVQKASDAFAAHKVDRCKAVLRPLARQINLDNCESYDASLHEILDLEGVEEAAAHVDSNVWWFVVARLYWNQPHEWRRCHRGMVYSDPPGECSFSEFVQYAAEWLTACPDGQVALRKITRLSWSDELGPVIGILKWLLRYQQRDIVHPLKEFIRSFMESFCKGLAWSRSIKDILETEAELCKKGWFSMLCVKPLRKPDWPRHAINLLMAIKEAKSTGLDNVLGRERLYIGAWLVHGEAIGMARIPLNDFAETIAEWMRAKVPAELWEDLKEPCLYVARKHLTERGVCPYKDDQIRYALDQQIGGLPNS